MNVVVVTGANGFVGRRVIQCLAALDSCEPVAVVRRRNIRLDSAVKIRRVQEIGGDTNWCDALEGADNIIHAAARVHVFKDASSDPLGEFRKVNVDGTLALANQAAQAGIKRFIFISSIGVNGIRSTCPITASDAPNPVGPYAISKFEAEQGLRRVAEASGMEVVVIRPPLIYGPNAPGNFGRLIRAVFRGMPLPLGAIHNKRSLIALDNLVDLIMTCLHHPAAANQTFLASDGVDISTTELVRRTAMALGRPARLIPVSNHVIQAAARFLGRPDFAHRLCGTLQVDISKTRDILGWTPPISLDDALKEAAQPLLNKGLRGLVWVPK